MSVYSEEQLAKMSDIVKIPSLKSSSRTGGKNRQTKLLEEYLKPIVEKTTEVKEGIDKVTFGFVVEKIIQFREAGIFDENTPDAILKIEMATYKEDSSKTAEENKIQKQSVNSIRYAVQEIFDEMGRKPRSKKSNTQEVDVPEAEVKEQKTNKKNKK